MSNIIKFPTIIPVAVLVAKEEKLYEQWQKACTDCEQLWKACLAARKKAIAADYVQGQFYYDHS